MQPFHTLIQVYKTENKTRTSSRAGCSWVPFSLCFGLLALHMCDKRGKPHLSCQQHLGGRAVSWVPRAAGSGKECDNRGLRSSSFDFLQTTRGLLSSAKDAAMYISGKIYKQLAGNYQTTQSRAIKLQALPCLWPYLYTSSDLP